MTAPPNVDSLAEAAGRCVGVNEGEALHLAAMLLPFLQRAFDLGSASPAPGTRARRIVQIATMSGSNYSSARIIALADDGSLWQSRSDDISSYSDVNAWCELPQLCAAPPAGQGSRSV